MEIESKRLKLQEVSWKDISDIHRLHSYPEVAEYNTLNIPRNIDETKVIIQVVIDDQKSEMRKLYFWKILPIREEWKDNYHYAIVEDDPKDY